MRVKRILCLLTLICLAVTAVPFLGTAALASAKYYITVDLTNQIVTVYKNGNTSEAGIVRQMICSTGKSGTPTPTGTYTLPSKTYAKERTEWYYFPEFNCYAKWGTRIYKGILFHSVLYSASKKGPTSSSVNALGSQASHGCVRLRVDDAKWIAQNCPAGTKCKVYRSGKANADLRKRLLKKSFSISSQTYDSFMGRAEGTTAANSLKINLYKGKKGAQVKQLQSRLKALGFYGGKLDSKFGSGTKTAVSAFQGASGLKKTGKVNTDLWKRIFADGAPTGTRCTLAQGWQGPVVKVLQQGLADLKMYSGAVDGVYGEETTAAVKRFQQCYNQSMTGKATGAMQNDVVQKARSVKAQFGEADYELVTNEVPVAMAKVNVKRYIRLKSKASTKGSNKAKLVKGALVRVLDDSGAAWTKVLYKGKTGFVQRKYLLFYTGSEIEVSFEPAAEPTPTPLPTPSLPGVETEGQEDGEPAAEPTPTPTPAALPAYAVVLEGGTTAYAEAGGVDALALLVSGETLEVVAVEDGWVAVKYGEQTAWVLADTVALVDELPEIPGQDQPALELGTDVAEMPAAEEPSENGLIVELEAVEETVEETVEENAGE